MTYEQVTLGPLRALVVRPRDGSFGHQVLELLMGLYLARHLGHALSFRRPDVVANAALFELTCDQVPVLQGEQAVAADVLASAQQRDREFARLAAVDAVVRQGGKAPKYKPAAPDFFGIDFRECYARDRLTLRLPERLDASSRTAARQLGIADDARIVTVHARESGFKQGQGGDAPADAIRNVRIETYYEACDLLQGRGYTVVRIGDPAMTPVRRPGIVDLATSEARTDTLELSLLLRSTLQIACDSGPYVASYLTGTPCLAVNVTNVLGGYPIRAHDRYLLKRVRDRQSGRELTLMDLLTPEYFATRKDLERYEITDNTPAEICGALIEMIDIIDECGNEPGAAQLAFRDAAIDAYNREDVAVKRTKKGEPARQLLGDGYVARAFVEERG